MKLSDHIRECEEVLRVDGDIDVMTPLARSDRVRRLRTNYKELPFLKSRLRVTSHPEGRRCESRGD